MRKVIAFRVAVIALTLPCATQRVTAAIVPPVGLPPGAEYQLVFITLGVTNSSATDISFYNSFVTSEAAQNPALPSTTWRAIGSTETIDASVNAPNFVVSGSYLPVYNTAGIEVSGAAGLYSGSLISPILYDQFGNSHADIDPLAWTGSNNFGTKDSLEFLGSTLTNHHNVILGSSIDTQNWLFAGDNPSFTLAALYALSGVLTVPVPEPNSWLLALMAILLMSGLGVKRAIVGKA